MKPKWKPNLGHTYHNDGTVSYWSVYQQLWTRQIPTNIPDKEIAALDGLKRADLLVKIAQSENEEL